MQINGVIGHDSHSRINSSLFTAVNRARRTAFDVARSIGTVCGHGAVHTGTQCLFSIRGTGV